MDIGWSVDYATCVRDRESEAVTCHILFVAGGYSSIQQSVIQNKKGGITQGKGSIPQKPGKEVISDGKH